MGLFSKSTRVAKPLMTEDRREAALADLFETVHYDDDPDMTSDSQDINVIASKYKEN